MMKYSFDSRAGDERKVLLERYVALRAKLERVPAGSLSVGQLMEVTQILAVERHPSSLTQHGGSGWLAETIAKMENLLTKATRKKKQKK